MIEASGQRKWIVCFDYDGKEKELSSNALTMVLDAAVGVPLNEVTTETNTGAETVIDVSTRGSARGDENNVSWCLIFFKFLQLFITSFCSVSFLLIRL